MNNKEIQLPQPGKPEFGPHPRRPNATMADAEAWWNAASLRERCIVWGLGDPEDYPPDAWLPRFPSFDGLPQSDRELLLSDLQKGWIDLGDSKTGL